MWVATTDFPTAASHPFYTRLNQLLRDYGFDDFGGGPVGANNPSNSIGGDNLNLGKPNSIRGNPRTFRVSLSYRF